MTSTTTIVPQCREERIAQYVHLCARAVRKFLRPGVDRADLQQVAAIGLLKACDRYDESLATPFEAYAWLFILGELMHYVRDYERLVRPPRRLRRLEKQAQSAYEAAAHDLGREPSRAEIAEKLGVPVCDMDDLWAYRERALAEPIDSVGATAAMAIAPVERWDDRLLLDQALQLLTEAERAIVVGLYAGGYSQIELAQSLGYSRRHISRLHRGALKKMQPIVAGAAQPGH